MTQDDDLFIGGEQISGRKKATGETTGEGKGALISHRLSYMKTYYDLTTRKLNSIIEVLYPLDCKEKRQLKKFSRDVYDYLKSEELGGKPDYRKCIFCNKPAVRQSRCIKHKRDKI